jgi:hypothetical protein
MIKNILTLLLSTDERLAEGLSLQGCNGHSNGFEDYVIGGSV